MKDATVLTADNLSQKIQQYKATYKIMSISSLVFAIVSLLSMTGVFLTKTSTEWAVAILGLIGFGVTFAFATKAKKTYRKLIRK